MNKLKDFFFVFYGDYHFTASGEKLLKSITRFRIVTNMPKLVWNLRFTLLGSRFEWHRKKKKKQKRNQSLALMYVSDIWAHCEMWSQLNIFRIKNHKIISWRISYWLYFTEMYNKKWNPLGKCPLFTNYLL